MPKLTCSLVIAPVNFPKNTILHVQEALWQRVLPEYNSPAHTVAQGQVDHASGNIFTGTLRYDCRIGIIEHGAGIGDVFHKPAAIHMFQVQRMRIGNIPLLVHNSRNGQPHPSHFLPGHFVLINKRFQQGTYFSKIIVTAGERLPDAYMLQHLFRQIGNYQA